MTNMECCLVRELELSKPEWTMWSITNSSFLEILTYVAMHLCVDFLTTALGLPKLSIKIGIN